MKANWVKVLRIIGLSFTLVFTLVLVVSAIQADSKKTCKGIDVIFTNDDISAFLNRASIDSILNKNFYNRIIGQTFENIDKQPIEAVISNNPYVEEVEVFSNRYGKLVLKIEQKKPLLRIINTLGVHYYLTKSGDTIPHSIKFTPRVLVAAGNINKKNTESLIQFATFIERDSFWNACTEHVYVNDDNTIELFSRLGDQNIILGKLEENPFEKLDNLLIFYRETFGKVDWNQYKSFNLNYKDQVVCIKI